MARPVIYLDVDGVLNALSFKRAMLDDYTWGDFRIYPQVQPDDLPFGQLGWDLCMSKTMVSRLAALPADVKWLTTWRHDAAKHVAPLVDAPEWPVLDWAVEKGAALAQDQAANPRPFVWIDDQEATEGNLKFFMGEQLSAERTPYLLIRPDAYIGISKPQMHDVEDFLDWLESLSHRG